MLGPRFFQFHRLVYLNDINTPPVLRSFGQRSLSLGQRSNFHLAHKMKKLGPRFFKLYSFMYVKDIYNPHLVLGNLVKGQRHCYLAKGQT